MSNNFKKYEVKITKEITCFISIKASSVLEAEIKAIQYTNKENLIDKLPKEVKIRFEAKEY